jgi:integrase/recombinase XerD
MIGGKEFPQLLQLFFTERLAKARQASRNTVESYRDTFRLLLRFAERRLGKDPTELGLVDLDAELICAFLDHIESERHNTARTRNVRLAAIHSFFRYAIFHVPEYCALIERILAIPPKRFTKKPVEFLTSPEIDAILASPDQHTWIGLRDYCLLMVAAQTGLRVSELTGLRRQDVHLGKAPHVRCFGKGRKQRTTPLTKTTATALSRWLAMRSGAGEDPLFPSSRGGFLSRDSVEHLLAKHVTAAAAQCTLLRSKKVSPHTMRHTAAMELLHHGVDRTVIALWLGHESPETTQIYLQADLSTKERALEKVAPHGAPLKRFRPTSQLLAFLQSL